jgi:NitT/TauT family transport system ATP-binding protein
MQAEILMCSQPTLARKIRVSGVRKCFGSGNGDVLAVERTDLEMSAGEFVAVVGESGCGKTTLLRLIAGLVEPTAGEIEVNGHLVQGPVQDVALVFQRPVLLDWRNLIDNVLLPVELAGLRRANYEERARNLLHHLDLIGFERKRPRQLSGGMQQRVALARALIMQPDVLLLDEPFSALDALAREQLQSELLRVWSSTNVTALLVTHDIAEAVFLADRVALMTPRPGRVASIFQVPLPRPRTPEQRYESDFIHLCRDIKQAMLELGND